MNRPGSISRTSPASEQARPSSSRAAGSENSPAWRTRPATQAIASNSASGLNTWCHSARPSALVAVAAAAASISSTSSQSSRPCSSAPTHHRPVASAATQTADRGRAMRSACHRNSTTPSNSAANWIAPNHADRRRDRRGDNAGPWRCRRRASESALPRRPVASRARLNHTRTLSGQWRACQLSLQQRPVHLEVGPERVPAVQGAARAVHAGLAFFLETAEHPVPDDQDAAVVAVQVAVVDGVVHAVIRRRAEPAVEPAECGHMLGVDPELVEQVDQRHHAEHQGRHAGQRHREVEDPSEQGARAGLPQRCGQVVVLALVMDHVGGPEDGAFVAGPVQPVVAEIVEHQRQQPAVPSGPEGIVAPQCHAAEDGGVDAHTQQAGEHRAELAEHAQADAVDRIVQPVGVAAACPAPGDLDRDQQQEDRCRQDDDLGRAQAHGLDSGGWRPAGRWRQP